MFGYAGMLAPSVTIHLSKLIGKNKSRNFQRNDGFPQPIFVWKIPWSWEALEQLGTSQYPKYFPTSSTANV
jgi:hypothetical protein